MIYAVYNSNCHFVPKFVTLMASTNNDQITNSGKKVENSPADEVIALMRQYNCSLTPPTISAEQKAAMAHNMWINLHRYEDPMDYMFEYSNELSSSEDDV